MSEFIEMEKVQKALDDGMDKAQEIMENPDQLTELLKDVQAKVKDVPVIGNVVNDLPVMVSLVKSYATKEYTEISPKVIASAVSALIYLIKRKDIISDKIPVIGLLDDLAVLSLALYIVKPELTAYTEWKNSQPVAAEAPEEPAA